MATTYALGSSTRMGFKFHTNDWDDSTATGTQLGAGDQLDFLIGSTPTVTVEAHENDAAVGPVFPGRQPSTLRTSVVTGTFGVNARFLGGGRLIAGLCAGEVLTNNADTSYLHTFTPAETVELVGTVAWENPMTAFDVEFAKVTGLSMSWENGGRGIWTASVMGRQMKVDGSGVNTTTTLNSLTLPTTQPTTRYMVLHKSQCTVRCNAQSGSALASGDRIYPNAITINLQKTHAPYFTPRNAPYQDEPVGGGWAVNTVTFGLPIYDSPFGSTCIAAQLAMTPQKFDITFTGDTIAGANAYFFTFEAPYGEPTSEGMVMSNQPGILPYGLTLRLCTAPAAPSGMTSLTAPFRIKLQDMVSAVHSTNGV